MEVRNGIPVTDQYGAWPFIYRHAGLIAHRPGHRRAARRGDRAVSDRDGAAADPPAGHHDRRDAGGRAERDLRPVGHLRADPVAARPPVCLAASNPRLPAAVPGADLRREHARRRHHHRDHDPADHHLGFPRDSAFGARICSARRPTRSGATHWEVIRIAVLSYARRGLFGAAVLGLGRALGETMAVTMVIGNRPEISASLFAPGYTLASVIANEFTEATTDLYLSALFELGLVLLAVTILVNVVAQLMLRTLRAAARGKVN